jgi:membrane protein implicated in regulation of membrane protease activity
VAIGFNRFPAMQSICSILLAGILITAAELITSGVLILIYGNAAFTSIMNNTQTLDGRIVKAACGVPANILFVVFVLIMHFVRKSMAKKKTQGNIAEASENNGI